MWAVPAHGLKIEAPAHRSGQMRVKNSVKHYFLFECLVMTRIQILSSKIRGHLFCSRQTRRRKLHTACGDFLIQKVTLRLCCSLEATFQGACAPHNAPACYQLLCFFVCVCKAPIYNCVLQ